MSETHSTDFAAQLELAWAAGFFDGEGHSGVKRGCGVKGNKGRCSYFSMKMVQCKAEPLYRFAAAVGGIGRVKGPYLNRPKNCQPIYSWDAAGETARRVIRQLWPYLCSVKREQAQNALDTEENVGNGRVLPRSWDRDTRTACPQGHEYTPENSGRTPRGLRYCKECKRVKRRAYTLRKKLGG